MTVFERIQKAIHSDDAYHGGTLDGLINLAYQMGVEDGVKDTSDAYSAVLKEQLENAKKCRYYKMARKVLRTKAGHRNQWDTDTYLYMTDYAQDVHATFGCDEAWEPKSE